MSALNCRMLEPLLTGHFPQMVGKPSEEWRAFLNETTGLSIGRDASNGRAFDEWRKALSKQGYPDLWVW